MITNYGIKRLADSLLEEPSEFNVDLSLEQLSDSLLNKDALGSTDPEQIMAEEFLPAGKEVDATIGMGIDRGLDSIIANTKDKRKQRLAKTIKKMLPADKIVTGMLPDNSRAAGLVSIRPDDLTKLSLMSEEEFEKYKKAGIYSDDVLLHESLHALLVPKLQSLGNYGFKNFKENKEEISQVKKLRTDWEDYRNSYRDKKAAIQLRGKKFKPTISEQQAFEDFDEFFVRSLADEEFRQVLNNLPASYVKESNGRSVSEDVKSFMGMEVNTPKKSALNYIEDNANKLLDVLVDM
jgi:hypothetical protein